MVTLSRLFLLSLTLLAPLTTALTQLSDTAYTALLNPSRGFITQQDVHLSDPSSYITTSTLAYPLSLHSVLGQAMIYLDTHLDGSAITDAELQSIAGMFAAYREAGMKVVVRFAYTDSESGTTDVNVTAMSAHIEQLGPVVRDYYDVIYIIQQGFIGTWGEQYYSTNYGTNGNISAAQWAVRNTIAQEILDIIPPRSFGQMRTPAIKQAFLNSTAVSVNSATKFSAQAGPMLGHFDDCLFGSTTDEGTYRDTTSTGADHVYIQSESVYTPRGGETCGSSDSASLYTCSAAIAQLSLEHWTFINIWNEAMLDAWTSGGCYDEMISHLGYRLELNSAAYDVDSTQFSMSYSNRGYASVMQPYNMQLILLPSSLVNTSSPSGNYTALVASLDTIDVRITPANATSRVAGMVLCPDDWDYDTELDPEETYEMFIAISDWHSEVTTNPAYRILFGTAGMQSGPDWVAKTRINRLGATATNVTAWDRCTEYLYRYEVSVNDGVLTGF